MRFQREAGVVKQPGVGLGPVADPVFGILIGETPGHTSGSRDGQSYP